MHTDLWYLREESVTDELIEAFWATLAPAEREKADRYRMRADRVRSVAARGLLRAALSHRWSEIEPSDWRLDAEEGGRPFVCGPQHPSISVAHTPGLVVVAVADEPQIGIDVENRHRKVDRSSIAARWFAPAEAELLRTSPPERFFWYWVLKEAYGKACGMGLGVGFDRVVFDTGPNGIELELDGSPQREWSFEVRELDDFYIGVAASRTPNLTLRDYSAAIASSAGR